MDLDEVAEELYGVPPEEFIASRRQREEEARAAGDRVLAKSIATLPKPSLAAWACNVLVRGHRAEIEGLVELGGLLREAQENLAGDQLRALSVQRNQLIAALSRQVVALTRQLGHPVSSGVAGQVEETLRAAMADPDAGEAVLSGRLTSPLSYSGLGTGQRPDLRVVPAPAERPAARRPPAGRGPSAAERRRQEEEAARQEEEAARREAEERRRRELAAAQQAADDATAAAEEAAAAVEAEQAEVDRLDARAEELQARVDELAAQLERAREECTDVGTRLTRAQRRRQTAERRATDAAAARDHALARLAELRRTD